MAVNILTSRDVIMLIDSEEEMVRFSIKSREIKNNSSTLLEVIKDKMNNSSLIVDIIDFFHQDKPQAMIKVTIQVDNSQLTSPL